MPMTITLVFIRYSNCCLLTVKKTRINKDFHNFGAQHGALTMLPGWPLQLGAVVSRHALWARQGWPRVAEGR